MAPKYLNPALNLSKLSYTAYCQAVSPKYGLYSEQDVSHIFYLHQREAPHAWGPRRRPCSPPPKAGTEISIQWIDV